MMHERQTNATCYGCSESNGSLVSYTGYSIPMTGPIMDRDTAIAYNDALGEDRWQEHQNWWRGSTRYLLLENGTVLLDSVERGSDGRLEVADKQIIARIVAMRDEDIAIDKARRAFAAQVAEDLYSSDPSAETAIRLTLEYRSRATPTVTDGIDFYVVGRNSSHEFYMGLRKEDNGSISLFSGYYEHEEGFGYSARETFDGGYYGHH